MAGRLYVVALPIGNLADITLRALETLRSVDFIVAEDTRMTRRILDRYEIRTPFHSSFYQGVEDERAEELVSLLREGKNLALVSDAGTPLVSDPGFPLVRAAVLAGVAVEPVPGATAAVAGLVASGLPADRFCFDGALPRKRSHRAEFFSGLVHETRTTVVYESPHRLFETLEILADSLPQRRIVLARELTKLHEEFLRGTAAEVLNVLRARGEVRGECVLIIGGGAPRDADMDEEAAQSVLSALEAEGLSKAAMQRILQVVGGLPRNRAYTLVHRSSD
ncbi:MAG: 16S rRNA (cytidine(1402)-2'-O)-methyltransferase [Candidatus Bipolaricaulota bacterium]|nr:16S rRNA (cytidine(1402)-2'-O)-methyltransferase [Candidatus Bipolaricaulota bacterium]